MVETYNVLANKGTLNINLESKFSFMYGMVQQGKRNEVIGFAGNCLKNTHSVFIFTDNYVSQLSHMKETICNIVKSIGKEFLLKHILLDERDSVNKLVDGLTTFNCIVVMNSSCNQIKKAIDIINKVKQNPHFADLKFASIFDEADVTTISADQTNRGQNARELFDLCDKVGFCSATPMANFWASVSPNILVNDVYVITPPPDYINIRDPNFTIEIEEDSLFIVKKEQITNNYIENLANMIVDGKKEESSPHIWIQPNTKIEVKIWGCLVTVSETIEVHNLIAEELAEFFSFNTIIVTMNESNVEVKSKSTLPILKGTYADQSLPQVLYEKIQLPLSSHTFNEKDSDIIILVIAGKMAGRGTPMRAELPTMPKDVSEIILINRQIFFTSNSATHDKITQMGLRMQGRYPCVDPRNKPTISLVTSQKIRDSLFLHMDTVDEQISKFEREQDPRLTIKEACEKLSQPFVQGVRPYSYARIKVDPRKKYIANNGEHYPTVESRDKVNMLVGTGTGASARNTGIDEDTLGSIILNILSNTRNWMSVLEIYNYYKDWNLETKTPLNTISTTTNRLVTKRYIVRKKNANNIYIYITYNISRIKLKNKTKITKIKQSFGAIKSNVP